jgi:hypothetical protein
MVKEAYNTKFKDRPKKIIFIPEKGGKQRLQK